MTAIVNLVYSLILYIFICSTFILFYSSLLQGVRCPADKPKCVVEGEVAKCVTDAESPSGTSSRLSRPALNVSPTKRTRPDPLSRLAISILNPQRNSNLIQPVASVPRLCFEPKKRGLCKAYFRSYFFNPQTGRCESFVYGGCGGNNNRFLYEHTCKSTCADPFHKINSAATTEPDVNPQTQASTTPNSSGIDILGTNNEAICKLNPDPGPCFALFVRFHFSPERQRCEMFHYGGCQGNGNNFESFSECMQTCHGNQQLPQQPIESQIFGSGIPAATLSPMPAFSLLQTDPNSNFPIQEVPSRPSDVTSGAGLTSTNTAVNVVNSSSRPSLCSLPKKVGRCRASMPRYFFNKVTETCQLFIYGGCNANKNNFFSQRECVQTCGGLLNQSGPNQQTSDPILYGNRQSLQPFPFWRNPATDATLRELLIQRQMRASAGMMGAATSNHFVCTQPVNQGSCFEKIQSFFFNSQTGRCEPFVFRGCGGNRNRFKTEQACQNFCSVNSNNQPTI